MSWRLLTSDGVSASFGLAADDALVQRVGVGESPATLRLYTYQSYCALVGRFQRIEHEIHLDFCQKQGFAVNRRPTGGGAIIMGADQLGIALTIPGQGGESYSQARKLMARFSQGIRRGLASLGIQAEFRRKNDIEVDGRKIVGLGIYRAPTGGLLFHGSLLVDLDVPLMLQMLNTPFEKISDKEINTVAARISTVRREMGEKIAMEEVRQAIAAGYRTAFEVELMPGDFTPAERQAIASLEQEKYLTQTWLYQTTRVPDAIGLAKIKTPGGLLDVRVTLAGRLLKAVYIGGDFFAADNAVADLEASLRWHSSQPGAIATTLERCYHRWQAELQTIPLAGLTEAIQLAVLRAGAAEAQSRSDPYGCFASPGAAYG